MPKYARVQDGTVTEVINIEGNEPPINERYHSDILGQFIRLTGQNAGHVRVGWSYDGTNFYLKPPPPPAPPNPEEVDEPPAEGAKRVNLRAFVRRLEARGKLEPFAAALWRRPDFILKALFGIEVIYNDNQRLRDILSNLGENPDDLLVTVEDQ